MAADQVICPKWQECLQARFKRANADLGPPNYGEPVDLIDVRNELLVECETCEKKGGEDTEEEESKEESRSESPDGRTAH